MHDVCVTHLFTHTVNNNNKNTKILIQKKKKIHHLYIVLTQIRILEELIEQMGCTRLLRGQANAL